MAENLLKAIISADGSQFTKTVQQLETQLKSFQNGLKNTTGVESIARLNRAIEVTKQRLDGLKGFTGLNQVQAGLQRTASSTNAANLALLNTGRIFQDLPFGILGVTNNINPLVESLQRASAAAKESGQSLGGTLLKSLTGAGGLGFAFSLVTAAATFASVGFSAFTRGMGGTTKSVSEAEGEFARFKIRIDEVTDSFKKLEESLDFGAKLFNLRLQIQGFEGADLNLGDFNNQINQNAGLIEKLTTQLNVARGKLKARTFGLESTGIGGSFEVAALIQEFGTKIPDTFIESLSDTDKGIAKELKISGEQIDKLNQQRSELINKNLQLNLQSSLAIRQQVEAAGKKAQEEAKKRLDEFLSLAKEITSRFPDLVPAPIDDLFDSMSEKIGKATVIVNDFKNGFEDTFNRTRFELTPNIFIDFPKALKNIIAPEIDIVKPKVNIISPEFNLKGSVQSLTDILFPKFDPGKASKDAIAHEEERIKNLTSLISTGLTPAFEAFFSSIATGGNGLSSFFKALGQSIQQLIVKLLAAAAVAAIINALLPGAGGFGKIFGQLTGMGGLFGGSVNPGLGGTGASSSGGNFGRGGRMAIDVNIAGITRGSNIAWSANRTLRGLGRAG